jgi:hypothetical protein
MVDPAKYDQVLHAIQSLVNAASVIAYRDGNKQLGNFLNTVEVIPKFIKMPDDMTMEVRRAVEDALSQCPGFAYILEQFDSATPDPW